MTRSMDSSLGSAVAESAPSESSALTTAATAPAAPVTASEATAPSPAASPRALWLLLAFAAIYLVWGSTYLAIRLAVASIPPFLLAGGRFLIAGTLLYAWSRWRRAEQPTRAQWSATAQVGIALLVGGNGLVCWAEQYVPSAQAALQVGTLPVWMVLFEWLGWGGKRPTGRVVLGLLAGLGGVVLLNVEAFTRGERLSLSGGVVLVFACMCWAAGSLRSRQVSLPRSPFLTTAMEMLAASVVLLGIAGLRGEWSAFAWSRVDLRAGLAVGYLIVFGSMVALSAYAWLLQVCPPARVATYAYVNPVVAVALGAAFGEAFTPYMLVATVIILAAVALLSRPRKNA